MHLSIALLDDYQRRAEGAADWASLQDATVTAFYEHLGDEDAYIHRPVHV